MKSHKKGFTLIELLVIVVIVGLLASVVLVTLGSAREKARDAGIVAEMNQIITSVEIETDFSGNYTGTCAMFGETGALYKFYEAVGNLGGAWGGCNSDAVSYSVLVVLNNGQNFFGFDNQITVYAENEKENGVHWSEGNEPILFSPEIIKQAQELLKGDYKIKDAKYYCVGMQPETNNTNVIMKGYMYDVNQSEGTFTGCGVLLENKFNSNFIIAAIKNGLIKDVQPDKLSELQILIDQQKALLHLIDIALENKDKEEEIRLKKEYDTLEQQIVELVKNKV